MPDEPEQISENQAEDPSATSPEPSLVEHLGAELSTEAAKVHAEIDLFWENYVRNSAEVPTRVHNYLHAEKEALKARIISIL